MDDRESGAPTPSDATAPRVSSFEQFFRDEYQQVLGLAYVLCGSWPAAEEMTMDGFEAALRHWSRVSAMDLPGAWVRRVVANSVASRFRRLGAERRAKQRLASRTDEPSPPTEGTEVWDAVRRLPRRQAQVLALFYVNGYRRKEIAMTLGISEESVKTHLERARSRLGEDLGDHG